MRPGAAALSVAIVVAGFAGTQEIRPFAPYVHGYLVDLPLGLAAAFLTYCAVLGATAVTAPERFASLGALGGALLAAAMLYADIVVGPPVRVPAAPGQAFSPPHVRSVAVLFPALPDTGENVTQWPRSAAVREGDRIAPLAPGQIVRANVCAFTAVDWPIARVRARNAAGRPVTTTQPNGAAFLSQYLTFPDVDTDGRQVDYFDVPPLHRETGVKYFPGLPERGIDVPFLALEIREEHGAKLYDGVAVDGRPLAKAGMILTFALGTYPSVIMSGAVPIWIFALGFALVVADVAGYAVAAWRTDRPGAAA
ncbi:MAG TPA: hypothetical protein VJN22_07110 [Candidatus Eremiobacteraceae bacterium]|nr:hypothetical protein [Candidatus Eremiobacteraceae bacterium]